MSRKTRQHFPRIGHAAIFAGDLSRQAQSWEKPAEWFLVGLERFVNTGDSLEHYSALQHAFPTFWPLPLRDGNSKELSWVPEGHKLFLLYRDLLRRFWIRDPGTLQDGFQSSLLFGTVPHETWEAIIDGTSRVASHMPLLAALAPLSTLPGPIAFPGAPLPIAHYSVNWNMGTIFYTSQLDFQRAVWCMFCQSWRAKVCPRCNTYFLAQKPAQLYCSTNCSSAVHRESSLGWWKKKGAQNRARARARGTGRKR